MAIKTKIELEKLEKGKKQEEMDFNKIEICKTDSLASFGELTHHHNNINHGNAANFVKNIKYKGEDESKGKQDIDTEMITKNKGINCSGINLDKDKDADRRGNRVRGSA